MKTYHHAIIILIIIVLIYFMYGAGLGAIPFLLAASYLSCLSIKEFRRFKKSKRW